jgi:hypothetical protein
VHAIPIPENSEVTYKMEQEVSQRSRKEEVVKQRWVFIHGKGNENHIVIILPMIFIELTSTHASIMYHTPFIFFFRNARQMRLIGGVL